MNKEIKMDQNKTTSTTNMTLNEYEERAKGTCMPSCDNFTYFITELTAEVGEINDKVAKWRRKGIVSIKDDLLVFATSDPADVENYAKELALELGDVLWTVATLSSHLGFSLGEIGQMNIDKLADRKNRGVIDGAGDNR